MLLFKLCADIGAEAGFLSVEKSVEKFGKLALIHFPFSIAGKAVAVRCCDLHRECDQRLSTAGMQMERNGDIGNNVLKFEAVFLC